MADKKVPVWGKGSHEVRWRRYRDPKWLPAVRYGYYAVAAVYLVWRTGVINWHSPYGILIYLAELYGIITTGLFLFVSQKVFVPIKSVPLRPYVADVLIPTYNEALDILEPVVIGATKIRGVNKVLVLDDGNRPEVRAMAERLGVEYHARTDNRHAKAGNLNNGLRYSRAEILITLDADHIPIPSFLEKTLGFFDDPFIAFVQSPQTFYNTHVFLFRRRLNREAWSEQMMFYNCLQPAKNNWNAAFFVGTSAVLRRAAIDDVGGFATGTATEDIHTSLRLHARGWQSVFLPEPLAYGLEAENFKEFYKQRRRWAAGSLGLLFRSPDSPLRARGLTPAQRLNYLSACLAHLQGLQKLCFLVAPIFIIFTNVPPVTGNLSYYALFFAAYFAVAMTATWAYSRGTYHFIYTEMFALANMLAHLGGILGILKVQKKFAVSNKSSTKRAGTYHIRIMWGLSLLALAAVLKAILSFAVDHRHTALVLSSGLFLSLNGWLLVSFLLKLRAYEKDESVAAYLTLTPQAKYEHITAA